MNALGRTRPVSLLADLELNREVYILIDIDRTTGQSEQLLLGWTVAAGFRPCCVVAGAAGSTAGSTVPNPFAGISPRGIEVTTLLLYCSGDGSVRFVPQSDRASGDLLRTEE